MATAKRMFAEKHYEVVAGILCYAAREACFSDVAGAEEAVMGITLAFAKTFARDDPHFDEDRFLQASSPGGPEPKAR